MLVVQGTADVVNPPACSIQLYNQAPQPKYFLSLEGRTTRAVSHGRAPLETVKEVTTGFLNGYLRHSASSLAALESQGSVPGLATISSAPAVGPEGGSCPGAPGLEGHPPSGLTPDTIAASATTGTLSTSVNPAASNSATHASGVMGARGHVGGSGRHSWQSANSPGDPFGHHAHLLR